MSASSRDHAWQNLLADVFTASQLQHRLRGLEAQVQLLVEDAQRNAASAGVPQSLIAKTAGVSQPRVSKITSEASQKTPGALARELHLITEWPGEALQSHASGFSGEMQFPPYKRPTTRWVPTIWRRDREWKQSDGRLYGETSPAEQEQADRRYWAVGEQVRAQKHPLVLAVEGKIERVYQVSGWILEAGEQKFTALGSGVWLRGEDASAHP